MTAGWRAAPYPNGLQHYFAGGRSLCLKWWALGPGLKVITELTAAPTGTDTCRICRNELAKQHPEARA